MGSLYYGATQRFEFDDYVLTHLRSVVLAKLNLQESTVFTWADAGKQHSLWLHPAVELRFEFESEETPDLNPAWVEQLLALASSTGGLRLTEEPPRPVD